LSPIDEVEEEWQDPTFGPISSLQRNHLAPATSIGQRQTEKQMSPDLKNDEKTKLSIRRTKQHTFDHLRDATVKVFAGVGVEVRQIYSSRRRSPQRCTAANRP
jgi:hypothetical protein